MQRTVSAMLLLVFAGFAQTRDHVADYALLLTDAPVAQMSRSRLALQSAAAQARLQTIRGAQQSVLAELRNRKVPVRGTSQILLNAIFISATRETAAQLQAIPGVAHVVAAPRMKRDLDQALSLENVSAAWSAAGGATNAGAGIKIGIVDSGIDQNHPGFQDPLLLPQPGFPKGDSNYTNRKVIVARSYVAMDSYVEYSNSTPDDNSPRDRVGHGTAIAMIAAGVQNAGPLATIQGVAPKAYLGNYKIFGSPGVNDYARAPAIAAAMEDAIADGMDIIALSVQEGDAAENGPLDVGTQCSSDGGPCDVYNQMVNNAVSAGLVVVVAAGNDGNLGVLPHTLSTIHTPGIAPAAITVGASYNSHLVYNLVHISGSGAPASLQNLNAVYGDGLHANVVPVPVIDVAALQNDGLACAALPANSLLYKIALIQRGTCPFSDKIINAQNAGAIGVVLYMENGASSILMPTGAQGAGIPAVMISNSDGVALKSYLASHSANAALDLGPATVSNPANSMWPSSSRGPSIGTFAYNPDASHIYQTYVIKPELVAVGAGIYTATQKLDPNGELYNPTGYTGVSGTSYAVPMVAGAVAIVKQKHPTWTPAQLKSAVVNTATQDVTDTDGTPAGLDAMGAGRLNAGNAMNVAATLDPATIEFGALSTSTVSNSITVNVKNVSGAPATFSFAAQPSTTSNVTSAATVSVSPASLTLQDGQTNSVSVNLRGTLPTAGTYDGFVVVTGGGGTTLRIPYQFLVSTTVVADVFPDANGGFLDNTGDQGFFVQLRAVDKSGIPIINSPVQWRALSAGASINNSLSDQVTFKYGASTGFLNMGTQPGPQIFTGTVGGVTTEFDGYARPYPVIPAGQVMDAATFTSDHGLPPGSFITIKGTDLADAIQVYSTNYLPVSLSDISVSFDGGGLSLPGHLHFVSPGQINVQVPWEFQGQSAVNIKVDVTGNRWFYLQSAPYSVSLAPYAPAFFLNGNSIADAVDGVNCPAPYIIGSSCAALRGQSVQFYASGLGPVDHPQVSGEPASSDPSSLARTSSTVTVTIGGQPAQVSFAGLAPGFVGLYQVNATVPTNIGTGNQAISISVGGKTSPATVNGLPVVLPVR